MRSACSPAGRRARRPPPAPPADRPARRPPPAPPLAALPVVLRLLSRWPPCPSSSACSPAGRPARRPPPAPPADRPARRPPSAPPADRPARCPPPAPPADRPARRPPAVSADGKKHFQLWPGFMFFRAVQPKKSLEEYRFLSALHSFKGQNRFTWQTPIRSIGRNPGLCGTTRKAPFSAFDSIRAAGI